MYPPASDSRLEARRIALIGSAGAALAAAVAVAVLLGQPGFLAVGLTFAFLAGLNKADSA